MRYTTTISTWVPSVHLINNVVLFAYADELIIHKDTTYGKLKKVIRESDEQFRKSNAKYLHEQSGMLNSKQKF